LALGCAAETGSRDLEENTLDVTSTNGLSINGLSVNGMSVNGLSANGLSANGLSANGLSANGLSANGLSANGAFASWFNQNPAVYDRTMKFIVRCALAPGHSTSFTDKDGRTYTWAGALGLADTWLTTPPTTAQKSWVSSCIMAHVNSALPLPKRVQISVRGDAPSLATTAIEVATLKTFDGNYFGDLFNSPNKMFVCEDVVQDWGSLGRLLNDWGRDCGVDGCGVFTTVDCQGICARKFDGSYGSSCTYGGKTYSAVSAYAPDYRRAGNWTLSNGANRYGWFQNSVDGNPITGLSNTSTAAAKINGWVTVTGNYVLGIRYSALQTSSLFLTVGASPKVAISFPPTATANTWSNLTVPVSIAAGASITFSSPGTGKPAPNLDLVWIEIAQ
jgi:hypothetical protein